MALKYEVADLEGIDEAAKALYKEKDGGGFVLDVAGVVPAEQFNEVNQRAVDNATEAARRRKTVERITSALGVDDTNDLDAAIAALKSAPKKADKDAQADQEAIIAQIKADHEKQLNEARGEVTKMKLTAAQATLTAEMQTAGFPAKVAEMIAVSGMARVSLDEGGQARVMSAEGNPMAGSGADGFATIGDLAKEFAAAMPELLTDKGKGGGGKAPSGGTGAAGQPNSQFGALAAKIPGFADLPRN